MNKDLEMIYTTMCKKSHGLLFDLAEVRKEFPQYSAQRLSAYMFTLTRKGLLKKVTVRKDGINVYKNA